MGHPASSRVAATTTPSRAQPPGWEARPLRGKLPPGEPRRLEDEYDHQRGDREEEPEAGRSKSEPVLEGAGNQEERNVPMRLLSAQAAF